MGGNPHGRVEDTVACRQELYKKSVEMHPRFKWPSQTRFALGYGRAIESRSAINSAGICSDAALRFSRRCLREDVPGIRRMLRERCRSQASATCMGVTLSDAAAVSSAYDCNGVKPPNGKNGT